LPQTGTSTSGNTKRIQAKSGRLVLYGILSSQIAHGAKQCTTKDNYLVAHYDLRPPHIRYFDASGNSLVIYEAFAHIAPGTNYALTSIQLFKLKISIELVASSLIMRHIALYNL